MRTGRLWHHASFHTPVSIQVMTLFPKILRTTGTEKYHCQSKMLATLKTAQFNPRLSRNSFNVASMTFKETFSTEALFLIKSDIMWCAQLRQAYHKNFMIAAHYSKLRYDAENTLGYYYSTNPAPSNMRPRCNSKNLPALATKDFIIALLHYVLSYQVQYLS